MQIAVASLALPGMPATAAAADAAAGTAGGITDFATLLLGQLTDGQLPIEVSLADASADDEDAADATTDPILLLAAMGLTLTPETRTDAAGPAKDADDDGLAAVVRGTLPSAAQAADGRALAGDPKAAAAGDDAAGDRLPSLTAAASGAGSTAASAANFAGREQKLAEPLHGSSEGTSQPLAGSPTHATTPRPAAEVQQHVATPVRHPAWSAEFGQKVVWMATQDKQSAQLTLNPPQMGPIEISLNIRNDQATAVFVSGNAEVREAIEAAVPRLREMLAGAGIELGQTNVSAESFRQAQEQANGRRDGGGDGSGNDSSDDGVAAAGAGARSAAGGALRTGDGLVDTFA